MEMFQYDFMQRAFLAALFVACISGILGLLLILRRQSLLADTLSHVSLSGVALGLFAQTSPLLMTLCVVMIASLAVEYLRQVYKSYSELSVAILMSAGLALALFLMSFTPARTGMRINQYLFGSIVTVSQEQVVILGILTALIVGLYLIFRKPIYVLLFDEDTAHTAGLPTRLMSYLLTLLTGATISLVMPIAGALLISSILILPTAIAMRLVGRFSSVMLVAFGISLVGLLVGLTFSYHYSTPPGATITLIFLVLLVLVLIFKKVKR